MSNLRWKANELRDAAFMMVKLITSRVAVSVNITWQLARIPDLPCRISLFLKTECPCIRSSERFTSKQQKSIQWTACEQAPRLKKSKRQQKELTARELAGLRLFHPLHPTLPSPSSHHSPLPPPFFLFAFLTPNEEPAHRQQYKQILKTEIERNAWRI